MTLEMLVIAAVRLLGSTAVLRWPFYGALLAIAVDQSDLLLMNVLELGGVPNYQAFDKYLDQVYLALFMVVAWRWGGIERTASLVLYVYRLAGFVAFELTQSRDLLLFFPNVFEFWFLFLAARRRFHLESRIPLTLRLPDERVNATLVAVVAGLVAFKLGQEYALHNARWLDGFTTLDVLKAIWHTLTPFT